jgi:hypothetical protein
LKATCQLLFISGGADDSMSKRWTGTVYPTESDIRKILSTVCVRLNVAPVTKLKNKHFMPRECKKQGAVCGLISLTNRVFYLSSSAPPHR